VSLPDYRSLLLHDFDNYFRLKQCAFSTVSHCYDDDCVSAELSIRLQSRLGPLDFPNLLLAFLYTQAIGVMEYVSKRYSCTWYILNRYNIMLDNTIVFSSKLFEIDQHQLP